MSRTSIWALSALLVSIQSGIQVGPVCAEEPLFIKRGTLVIAGGGRLPESITSEFCKLAGGKDSRLVIIPTASSRADSGDTAETRELWRKRGGGTVSVLHTRDRNIADNSEFVGPIRNATGVWFSGGSQSRITDAYLNTETHRELKELLDRGGVIGGSSAGAAIMSEVMITGGNPQPETAAGFGWIERTIIDQHFLRRNRANRLIAAMNQNSIDVGIGIDEGTAIVVDGSQAKVVGESYVTVLTRDEGELRIDVLRDKQTYSLAKPAR